MLTKVGFAEQYKNLEKEIVRRMIDKYVLHILEGAEDNCPVAREVRAVFDGCKDWLEEREQIKE